MALNYVFLTIVLVVVLENTEHQFTITLLLM